MDLSFAKQADEKTKNLIFGFIRKAIPKQSIPMVINYLCVLYYLIKEKFENIASNHLIQILSNQNDMIESKSCHIKNDKGLSLNTSTEIFGCFKIDFKKFSNHVFVWQFDILCDGNIGIGIKSYLQLKLNKHGPIFYVFQSNGTLQSDSEMELDNDSFGKNDIIQMELNTMNKSLIFYKNYKSIDVKVDKIKTNSQYTMFVQVNCFRNNKIKIKLIDFKITSLK